MRPSLQATVLVGCLLLAGSSSLIAAETFIAPLEPAPGELGELRSDGRLLFATSEDGKQLVVLDVASGTLRRYLEESGELWGRPVVARDVEGGFFEQVFNLAVNGASVALLSPRRLAILDRNGAVSAWSNAYMLASDITPSGSGWALALRNMPSPGPGGVLGQEALTDYDPPPRIIELDPKLRLTGAALPVEEGEGRSAAIAESRALRLTSSGDRLFAAEQGNYTVYELSNSLRLRDVYREPELQLEAEREGGEMKPLEEHDPEDLPNEVLQYIALRGENLSGGDRPKAPVMARLFSQRVAVRDVAWDERSGRLLLLLEPTSADAPENAGVLDLLDPLTGDVERLLFRMPGARGLRLSRVLAGHDSVWLHGSSGEHAAYRLDRLHFVEAVELEAPERESAAAVVSGPAP